MEVDKKMHIVCGMKMGKNRIYIKWDGRILNALMMEAVHISETSINCYQTT
jgi:hypothetical protein